MATQTDIADVPKTPSSIVVELGVGESSFGVIADGTPVSMTHGPQGGQHVWASVRLRDEGFGFVQVNLTSRYVDTGELAGESSGWMAELSTPMEGMRTHAGMKNYVSSLTRPRLVLLRAEVVTPDGRHGADERTVMLSP